MAGPIENTMQFSDFSLDQQLQQAIRKAGFAKPTPIQERAIPLGLAGHDLIGTAQTGTGKTAAFVLPILQRLLADPRKLGRTRALIVTPTRELAEQINTTIRRFTGGTSIRSATVYGGVGMQPQERALRSGVEIIVACPGRLLDHIDRGAASLNGVEMLVLDEADRMLDMGFLPSVRRILSYVPRQRQTMLFSATFAPELQQLAADTLRSPKRVDVATSAPVKTVAHALYPVAQHLKTKLLLKLLSTTDTNSVLIFTRTKHRANRVAEQIQRAGYNTAVLHSNKSQNQRQLALDNFRSGKVQILVATDIAARGIDVATISHVINYDIPDTADTYIHRIGRTGRAEREGDAMTLVTSEDAVMCRDIERALKAPIERRTLPDFDYSAPAPVLNEFQREPRAQQPRKAQAARPHGSRSKQPSQPRQQQPQAVRANNGAARKPRLARELASR
jgi:ATP-dependent RNA helicase RhlE